MGSHMLGGRILGSHNTNTSRATSLRGRWDHKPHLLMILKASYVQYWDELYRLYYSTKISGTLT